MSDQRQRDMEMAQVRHAIERELSSLRAQLAAAKREIEHWKMFVSRADIAQFPFIDEIGL